MIKVAAKIDGGVDEANVSDIVRRFVDAGEALKQSIAAFREWEANDAPEAESLLKFDLEDAASR
jgi:hypothetical protein